MCSHFCVFSGIIKCDSMETQILKHEGRRSLMEVIKVGSGQKVGKLDVVEGAGSMGRDLQSWLFKCRCECGKELILSAKVLFFDKKHRVQSCGCDDNSINLVGQKFGMYTVLSKAEYDYDGQLQWICQCECGTIKKVRRSDLLNRRYPYPNCGCYAEKQRLLEEERRQRYLPPKKELTEEQLLRRVWHGMKRRCYNPDDTAYKNYGGRGIYICARWKDNFQKFYDDMHEGYEQGLQIDRIDNDGPYSPENCRWATPKENQRNKRNNHFITTAIGRKTITEQAEISGVKISTINGRLKNEMPEELVLVPSYKGIRLEIPTFQKLCEKDEKKQEAVWLDDETDRNVRKILDLAESQGKALREKIARSE